MVALYTRYCLSRGNKRPPAASAADSFNSDGQKLTPGGSRLRVQFCRGGVPVELLLIHLKNRLR